MMEVYLFRKYTNIANKDYELAIQKRKVEDDLNDIYHERKKLMIEKECDDGN